MKSSVAPFDKLMSPTPEYGNGLLSNTSGGPSLSKKPRTPVRQVTDIADETGVSTDSLEPIVRRIKKLVRKRNKPEIDVIRTASISDPKASEIQKAMKEILIPKMLQSQQTDNKNVTGKLNKQQLSAIATVLNMGKALALQAKIIQRIDRNTGNMISVVAKVLQGL